MKRIICLLLVIMMLVPAVASCDGGNVSEDTSFSPDTTLEDTTEEPTADTPTTDLIFSPISFLIFSRSATVSEKNASSIST